MLQDYDVIVVGAGHAGNEAAAAAANLGSSVLLITMNMNTIGQMSCNPAMGGIAKGQILREIDALGGYSGIVSDESTLQFRMLNRSKGPAMWSPRTQNDRMRFSELWRMKLEAIPRLDFFQDMVTGILLNKDGSASGVITSLGTKIKSKSVILTSGTFLNGVIHIGTKQMGGGRAGEKASVGISEQLVSLGFTMGRMKTGTPPRLDGRSIDYTKMERQDGDQDPGTFSYIKTATLDAQLPCFITYTNTQSHDILRTGFDQSPMFNGRIGGIGPRYCPSIEDKLERFSNRDRHQLFVEPEGRNTCEIYLNGFSSSLPEDIQYAALKAIRGLENVKMFRPGYAIEYDFFAPTQLAPTLETKDISNLFFAGQINGTTGYEEAACQGLIAGINAHRKIHNLDPFVLGRSQAYIGVLIDDLINKGTEEPYRMFTSRAEFRILLRQDNADLRLTPLSHSIGLANDLRLRLTENKRHGIKAVRKELTNFGLTPQEANPMLRAKNSSEITQQVKAKSLLARPHLNIWDVLNCNARLAEQVLESIKIDELLPSTIILVSTEIQIKYQGYIEKEQELADKMRKMEDLTICESLHYEGIPSLSSEARQKLCQVRPTTLGQASRISGVSPADVAILMLHLAN